MNIQITELKELKPVLQFYREITFDLKQRGIKQWDRYYPNRYIIKADIKKGNLFGFQQDKKIIGAVVVDTNQNKNYCKLSWADGDGRPLIIHRLAVHPLYQGKGYGKKLLHFVEEYALLNGYSSIRLDVFSLNEDAVNMYERAGYHNRGMVRYPFRTEPYKCFEKIIKELQA